MTSRTLLSTRALPPFQVSIEYHAVFVKSVRNALERPGELRGKLKGSFRKCFDRAIGDLQSTPGQSHEAVTSVNALTSKPAPATPGITQSVVPEGMSMDKSNSGQDEELELDELLAVFGVTSQPRQLAQTSNSGCV